MVQVKAASSAGDKIEAVRILKHTKVIEIKWAALEYDLKEAFLEDVASISLISSGSAELNAEDEKLTATMMESLGKGEPAPPAVIERLKAVKDRLKQLQEQMESGELTMDLWLTQLKKSIARDERLVEALRSIKKNKVSKHAEICIKYDDICITNDENCI